MTIYKRTEEPDSFKELDAMSRFIKQIYPFIGQVTKKKVLSLVDNNGALNMVTVRDLINSNIRKGDKTYLSDILRTRDLHSKAEQELDSHYNVKGLISHPETWGFESDDLYLISSRIK